jgi:hypothetical protein
MRVRSEVAIAISTRPSRSGAIVVVVSTATFKPDDIGGDLTPVPLIISGEYDSTAQPAMAAPLPQLSIEEQRQILFSSFLKYSPEVACLRDRALDRVVLGALIGTADSRPIQTKDVQKNIHFLKNGPSIREELIHETLVRLERVGKIQKGELKRRRVFWLTEKGSADVNSTVAGTQPIFDNAFREILANTNHHFPYEQGVLFCRRILLQCFAKIGRDLARGIYDPSISDAHFTGTQIRSVVLEALAEAKLPPDAKESLSARIFDFFKSHSPAASRLKFHLAQGFYFTELLGLDRRQFNPLIEQSFAGSVFYLDANVLLLSVFETHAKDNAFGEVVRLAKEIGIALVVTRATLNEVRKSGIEHIAQIRKFEGLLPDRLTEKTDDQFVLSYRRLLDEDSSFTLDKFTDLFCTLDATLREKWGVQIDERIEDDILKGVDTSKFEEAINAESEAFRAKRKSPSILRHDVSHWVLVSGARVSNQKTWFLTRDGILARAARKLSEEDWPLCFSLVGFLHSISPFVTTNDERPFSELFGEILDLQIAPDGVLYDASELALIAEMHADVLATPAEQLIMALDYVKSKELDGETYDIADYGKVALGLKRFLTHSKDEQLRAVELERTRLDTLRQEADSRRVEAERISATQQSKITAMEGAASEKAQREAELRDRLRLLQENTVTRKEVMVAGVVGLVPVIAIIGAFYRDAMLANLPDTGRPVIASAVDLLCVGAILWAIAFEGKLLIKDTKIRKAALFGTGFVTLLVFVAFRGTDVTQLGKMVDLLVKVVAVVTFLGVTLFRGDSPTTAKREE